MPPDNFRTIGENTFGYGWQSKLARTFEVNPRTVRRWASGEYPVPKPIEIALLAMNDAKQGKDKGR